MKTKNIFKTGELFYWIDSNISLLPDSFKEKKEKYESIQLEKSMTFQQMKDKYTPDIFTLGDVYNAIESGQCQENGSANFFFVEDKNGSVSVVDAYRVGRRWLVDVYRPDCGFLWRVAYRLFVRNSETKTLKRLDPSAIELQFEKRISELEAWKQKVEEVFSPTRR